MATCTQWVNRIVLTCKNWATELDQKCSDWANEGSNQCSSWENHGHQECNNWADEGNRQCSEWGKNCKWYTFWKCVIEWFCKVAVWVSKWVCHGWYTVANWVCQAWYFVSKWVCKAWAFIVKTICTLWSWGAELVCIATNAMQCMIMEMIELTISIFKKKKHSKINHVFVLVLENRSFDHMFGFSNITGKDAITDNPTKINGSSTLNTNTNFDNPTDTAASNIEADYKLSDSEKDPGHEFEDILVQLCGKDHSYDDNVGIYPPINNSGFYYKSVKNGSSGARKVMDSFSPIKLPILNKLANEFAICDNWFSALPGPTWPNRFFLHAATSGGLDNSPGTADVASSILLDGYRFENGNIFDKLDNACKDWMIFEGDEFPQSFAMSGMSYNALQGRFKDLEDFESEVNEKSFSKKYIFIEPDYGKVTSDYTCGNSMHPTDDVRRGERLIKRVYETIRNSPHWNDSVLLITFDEHGGFYDHVAPPAAVPPGDLMNINTNKHSFKFDQLGVRVPAIVISPFVKKNIIDHTQYTHASLLSSLEKLLGLSSLTNTDRQANDFLHLLSLENPRIDAPTQLPSIPLPDSSTANFVCKEDRENEELIMSKLVELNYLKLKQEGKKPNPELEIYLPSDRQTMIAFSALRKAYHYATPRERNLKIEQFKNIKTSTEADIFILEAKLKVLEKKQPKKRVSKHTSQEPHKIPVQKTKD
jgi:phospholipase C